MERGLLAKRIPTILGLLILVAGLVAGILLVGQRQGLFTRAGPTSTPKNVKISNLSSTGFAISWTTDVPVTGFIKYSDNPTNLTLPAGDSRDQVAGSVSPYTTHYVEVSGLTADKTYYFEIGTGSQTYNDSGKPYQVRIFPTATTPPEDVVSGKVLNAAGTGVSGAIVYVELTGSGTLSALTRNDGTFRLNLSLARDKTGKFLTYDVARDSLTILVQAGTDGTATAITNTARDNPVPDITLGKTHNFADGQATSAVISDTEEVSSTGFGALGEAILAESPEATLSVKLLNPATKDEQLATTTPEFLGTGPVGVTIKIIVQSDPQTGYATVSASGNWSWSPPDRLDPGTHTITLEFLDALGVLQRFSRSFVVLAAGQSGGLPAFESTPSATPTATVSATPTATISATPTVSPTATPSGIPDAGVLTPTMTLLFVGIGLFFVGVIWKKRLDIDF